MSAGSREPATSSCWIPPRKRPGNSASVYARQQRSAVTNHSRVTTHFVLTCVYNMCLGVFLQNERVLFHYNAHGVPKPTQNGEIWVFNKVCYEHTFYWRLFMALSLSLSLLFSLLYPSLSLILFPLPSLPHSFLLSPPPVLLPLSPPSLPLPPSPSAPLAGRAILSTFLCLCMTCKPGWAAHQYMSTTAHKQVHSDVT